VGNSVIPEVISGYWIRCIVLKKPYS